MAHPVFRLTTLFIFLLTSPRSFTLGADDPTPTGQNFVFFLVDDLGWRDVGALGSSFYETPSIDALAAGGTRFSQAYAACPVCSPTRASILTGRYPVRVGITDFISPSGSNQPEQWKRGTPLLPAAYSDRLAHEEVTLAEVLKEAGYATFFAGKWHLGPEGHFPEDQGFDHNKGGLEFGSPPQGGKRYFSSYANKRLPDGPPGEHLPARLAKETVDFIGANKEKPFLAYLSFYSVHTPLMGRQDLIKKYVRKRRKLLHEGPRWEAEGPRQDRLVQDHPIYAAMVEATDLAIHEVLEALDRHQLTERTTVIFFSDNGGLSTSEGHPTSNRPLRAGKGWLYEGGIREPCLIRSPGRTKPGTVCDVPIVSTDFFPTILELAGLASRPDLHQDGLSLVPLLAAPDATFPERAIYWHYPHYGNQGGSPAGAIRVGSFKLIQWFENDRLELYHIPSDIGERRNRATEDIARALSFSKKLTAWQKAMGVVMPTPNPKPNPARAAEAHRTANRASRNGRWR